MEESELEDIKLGQERGKGKEGREREKRRIGDVWSIIVDFNILWH